MISKTTQAAVLAVIVAILNACGPPVPVPAPYFIPNPPYPPQPIESVSGEFQNSSNTVDQIPPSTPTPRIGEYPLARPASRPNEVISPYEPYHTIDISGFSRGQLARDPSNKKIFRVP